MLCTVCATTNGRLAMFCQGCGMSLEALHRVVADLTHAARPFEALAPPVPAPRLARLLPKQHGLTAEPGLPVATTPLVVGRFSPRGGPVDLDIATVANADHVSRRHARLFFEAGGWHVADMGSANGTFVRAAGAATFSEPIAGAVRLADGDEIAFGTAVFVFREG